MEVALLLRTVNAGKHAVQIVQIGLTLGDLLREHLLRRLGIVVTLIVAGGVLLGRQEGIQRDLHLGAIGVVVVLADQLPHSLLHGIEVGGNELAAQAQQLPVLRLGQLLTLVLQLAGGAVAPGWSPL